MKVKAKNRKLYNINQICEQIVYSKNNDLLSIELGNLIENCIEIKLVNIHPILHLSYIDIMITEYILTITDFILVINTQLYLLRYIPYI